MVIIVIMVSVLIIIGDCYDTLYIRTYILEYDNLC